MSRWPLVAIGDVAESVDYGVTASASDQPVGPKFLRITDIQAGAVDWSSVPWCECDPRSASDAKLKPGDIVFARTGATTGKSFLIRDVPPAAVFASYLIRVRVGDLADPRYIGHFFQTPHYWAQITTSARGVAQPGVNATTLKGLKLPLPPVLEQRRIAATLDKADALRAMRRAAIAKLDTLVQSIFLDMFGDPATNPKGWPTISLKESLTIPLRNGLSPSKAGRISAEVLTLSAITGARFDEFARKVSTFQTSPPAEQAVNCSDFLICRGNGNIRLVARGQFPTRSMPEVTFPDTMIAARVSDQLIKPAFLTHVWNSNVVRHQIESLARTTNGTFKINQTMLEETAFICPPLRLQGQFSDRIASIAEIGRRGSGALVELDTLFASLQHRAFRGEL